MIDSPNPPERPRVDLRSAASGAAIELDNIRLKRKNRTSSIEQLIEVLAAGVPAREHRDQPMNLITPTVIVMNEVVRSSKPDATISEVVSDLEAFLEGLKRVVSQPASVGDAGNGTIEQLQLKCLDISRFAARARARYNVR